MRRRTPPPGRRSHGERTNQCRRKPAAAEASTQLITRSLRYHGVRFTFDSYGYSCNQQKRFKLSYGLEEVKALQARGQSYAYHFHPSETRILLILIHTLKILSRRYERIRCCTASVAIDFRGSSL
jgi:hypothetical protein